MKNRIDKNKATAYKTDARVLDRKQSFFVEYPSVICALATPFYQGKVDVESYVKLCKRQQETGADALLVLGTTAEAQLLSDSERMLLVTLAKQATSLPLLVGIEEPSTMNACKQAEIYARIGADALMIAPPSFCKCTAEGYVRHVESIAHASGLPIALYNIPSRAGYALNADAVKRLADSGIVSCVKDSCANVEQAQAMSAYTKVLCGCDELLREYLAAGAVGVVSVVSNVAPQLTREALQGNNYERFNRLARLAMREVNPVAIKYMLYKAGVFKDYEMRLPLTRANEKTQADINAVFEVNDFTK